MPSGSIVVSSRNEVYTAVLPDYVVVTSSITGAVLTRIVVPSLEPSDPFLYWSGGVSIRTPMTLDTITGELLVAAFASSSLCAINVTSHRLVTIINLAAPPTAMAFDDSNGDLFVLAQYANSTTGVFVVGAGVSTYPLLHTVWWPGGFTPGTGAIVVDTVDQIVYFTGYPAQLVTSYYGSVYWFAVGSYVISYAGACAGSSPMTFDPASDEVYLTNGGSECEPQGAGGGAIAVISGASHLETSTVSMGTPAYLITALAYDGGTRQVYAASPYSVAFIDPASHTVVVTYQEAAQCPSAIAPASGASDIYVADECGDGLAVVSHSTGASTVDVVGGWGPTGVALDPSHGDLVIPNQCASNVSVFSTASNSLIAAPSGILDATGVAYDSATGETWVAGWTGSVAVLADKNWSVIDRLSLPSDNIAPPIIAYDPLVKDVYVDIFHETYPLPSNLTVINGTTHQVAAEVSIASDYFYPTALAYDATNRSMLLGFLYSNNSILEINTTARTVAAYHPLLANASVDSIADLPSVGEFYVGEDWWNASATSHDQGALVIYNATGGTPVAKVLLPSTPFAMEFNPSWNEMLLAATFNDSVSMFNVESHVLDGTFVTERGPVAMALDNQSGAVYVVNYISDSLTVITHNLTYPVSVQQTGLPSGDSWTVTVNGVTRNASGSSIVLAEPNGTYNYSVGAPPGYLATPASGIIDVRGLPVVQNVKFSRFTFSLTFRELGLPLATLWSATVNDSKQVSKGSTLVFQEPNGTYRFGVGDVTGYSVNPLSGNVTIWNASQTIYLTYAVAPGPASSDEIPLWIEGSIACAIVASVAILVILPARPPRGPGSS
jgi:hypothetical protein